MNKREFAAELSRLIGALSDDDRQKSVDYYLEMIDDRMEDGMTEEDAVADIGTPAEIAVQILSEAPQHPYGMPKYEEPKRQLQGWELALLIIGAPLWIPLLAAALVIVLSVYIVIWSVVIALYSAPISIIASGFGAAVASVGHFIDSGAGSGLIMIGGGLFLVGLAVFAFFGCNALFGLAVTFTKKSVLWIISLFKRKEHAA